MNREKIIAEIKLKWQKHNRDNGLSWNEVAELVNEVAGIDHQKEQEGMGAEMFYEKERIHGRTDDITMNPDPDYNEAFYQNIFRLMEQYAASRIAEGEKQPMSADEFCKIHSAYCGEQIDNIKQLTFQNFTGDELFEFCQFVVEQYAKTNKTK